MIRFSRSALVLSFALSCLAAPGRSPAEPALDRDVFEGFLTNSIESFTRAPLPADQKVKYALALAGVWANQQNRPKASAYLDAAIKTAQQHKLKNEEAAAWMGSAVLADMADDLPAALKDISKAVSLSRGAPDGGLHRQALLFKANLLHRRGMYADSISTFKDVLALSGDPAAAPIKAECLSEIAILQYKLGETKGVAPLAREALTIFQSLHNVKGEADCLKVLGNLAGGDGHTKEALEYYGQAAAKYRAAGNLHGQANCLYNMGITLQQAKQYKAALTNLQDAVAAYTKSASVEGVGIANMALGKTYFLMGDLSKASVALEMAQSLLTKAQDLCRLAEIESDLAELTAAQGDKTAAIAHHEEAIRLYKQAGLDAKADREKSRLKLIRDR